MEGVTDGMFRFEGYQASRAAPNVVVDGSPNESTTLTLTHWPGIAQPPGLGADLSAEMAFKYLDHLEGGGEPLHGPAAIATNNHFDQDGLVGLFALINPTEAQRHRELLIDVAGAGDFAVYSDRRAARASMIIASFGNICDVDTSVPGAYDEFSDSAYEATLPLLVDMLVDQDRFEERWRDEDAVLLECERLLADGTVRAVEIGEPDGGADSFAIIDVPEQHPGGGHRFGSDQFGWVHPMAINNALSSSVRLLMRSGRRYRYVDRYETWVQFCSRSHPARVDLAQLAEELTALETRDVTWSADPPSALTPQMTHDGESSIDPDRIAQTIARHLRDSPPAWQPFADRE